MPKDKDKPKGRMSSYAYFVQCCREEHKKKHPGENVVFAEFTKKCASKWKVSYFVFLHQVIAASATHWFCHWQKNICGSDSKFPFVTKFVIGLVHCLKI